MDPKIAAAGAIGAGIGTLQTPLLREYVDKVYPTWRVPQLKGFGTPSALIGMIGGGASLAVGAIGMTKGKDGRPRLSDAYVEPAIDYGVTALVGGLLSGIFPQPLIGTVVSQPTVQTATYRPPTGAVDMNVLRQMSSELQRLAQENAQLKSMAPAITVQPLEPGTVSSKQAQYGFMEPNTMFVPGQPTRPAKDYGFMAAREGIAPHHLYEPGVPLAPEQMFVPGQPTRGARGFGFMDGGTTPVAAVQQMKARFDFSG